MSDVETIVADDGVTRREFTLAACVAILTGAAITVTGCGGSYSSPAGPSGGGGGTGTGGSGDKQGAISANHGHTATITGAELSAGNAVTIQLTIGDGHTHTLDLSANQVMSIAANQRISQNSSVDAGHSHSVTFN
jgi:hypothetical protein